MKLVLVVCKGNIHRSVIAEFCIRKNLTELGLESRFMVDSRGLLGSCDTAMPKFPNMMGYTDLWQLTEPLLKELEIKIPETQKAIPVDRTTAQESSLILAMNREILCELPNCLVSQFPDLGFKMRLFSEMAVDICDVPDCDGKTDAEMYKQVISAIYSIARTGTKKMCQLADLLSTNTPKE